MAQTADTKFVWPRVPGYWPKWNVQCDNVNRKTGHRCLRRAKPGDRSCHAHGSGGKRALRAWKRYLMWVLIYPRDPAKWRLPDEAVKVGAQVLARAMLAEDDRLDGKVTTRHKLKAAMYLMDADSHLRPKRDVLTVLAEAMPDASPEAIQAVHRALERGGHLRDV